MEPNFLSESLYTLLENIPEGVHITDQQGITQLYNQSAANIDGINPQKALGKHVLEMFPSLTEETSTILQVLRTGESVIRKEQEIRNLYGIPIYLLTTSLPIRANGRIVGAIDISQNLTQVKLLAEKIVDLHSDLKLRPKRPNVEHANYTFNDIIGQHPALLEVIERAKKAARTDSPILVHGETGTGKELLVQSIHNHSPRRNGPFISQNCAALPATLMESILFGTSKGSFTGAENRIGLVELADGGTLFLDELTCLDFELQAKLLRFIQEKNIRRIGDSQLRPMNVRIITSTNMDPAVAVKKNLLRPDLYYRLNVVSLKLPPLRERSTDIPILTQRFITELNQNLHCQISSISPPVQDLFSSYPWPGNIRELRCTLEGAMNLAETDSLEITHLPPHLLQKALPDQPMNLSDVENLPLPEALGKVEKTLISSALEKSKGNVSQAAKILGLPRQTLQYKIQALGIKL
ncbi:PAS domain S-box [Desulfosporosinus acidiphilus SJ4]|uniref:PAS domain S-box n=1 Tax=Desulfosporosinus acidiphilus (strain DSM 22704 / JCM 16185 / SJ4) TaxID=646529 RepID=I4D4X4_DESAJ|nr:sigma-54-dependent Fis family transcriptional regulator [Desulfosporosinus acidiphilus]AFM40848.1 PAS domain S-box [Desulfosporosinus acidiphilus SJ4]